MCFSAYEKSLLALFITCRDPKDDPRCAQRYTTHLDSLITILLTRPAYKRKRDLSGDTRHAESRFHKTKRVKSPLTKDESFPS